MSSSEMGVAARSTRELVDGLASFAAELAQREAPDSPAACFELAESLAAAVDRCESALAGLIERVDATGETARWGLPSTLAWLRTRLGMREARAKERLALARERHRLPTVTRSLASGELSYGYAATVAGAVKRLSDDDCAKAEEILLDLADQGFSPGRVAAFGHRITDLIAERDDVERPDSDTQHGYEHSWIDSTRSLDGGRFLRGWLNAEDAAVWDAALGGSAKPAGADDRRDLAERTAAALLTQLAGGHQNAKVTVMVDLETLTGGAVPARLSDGTPVPAEQARRLALTAGVSPLILGSQSVPLYLGRRVRFATPAQRRVLETLYATCAVQGCEVPGTLSEIDHVDGWALGDAPTDIDRLTLCCGWHNRWKATHPHQIRIDRLDGRYIYHVLPPNPHTKPASPATPTTPRRTANSTNLAVSACSTRANRPANSRASNAQADSNNPKPHRHPAKAHARPRNLPTSPTLTTPHRNPRPQSPGIRPQPKPPHHQP